MERTDPRPLYVRRASVVLRIADLEAALFQAHKCKAEIETTIEERERAGGEQHAAE